MTTPPLDPQVAAARAYEELFVPALFRQWAPVLAEAARIAPGCRVLDVACGTGVLARELAPLVGAGGTVVGLDPTPGMLAVARELAPEIEWREGTAEELPFPDGSFDAVVSQFGLMFFGDRVRSLREMRRVLTPGGRFAVAVWGALDSIPAIAEEVAVLERVAGRAAADALRAPFSLGDATEVDELFRAAGFDGHVVRTHAGTARFPSVRTLVEADLRGWLPVMGVVLDEEVIQRVLDEADRALAEHVDAKGEAVFEVSAHVVSGAAP